MSVPPATVARIADVVMFENWLRFYFIAEEGDQLLLRLPEKAMEQIKNRYAAFYELAEYLNNEVIDHATSLKAVCMQVSSSGGPLPPLSEKTLDETLDSPQFQAELQLFSSWVQAHEEQLDERFMEFSQWQTLYAAWKETPEVRELARKLRESLAFDADADARGTTQ